MNTGIHLFILIGGVLQAMGSAMNAQLYKSLLNPWLASLVSFSLIVCVFICAFALVHKPLPSVEATVLFADGAKVIQDFAAARDAAIFAR
jgi:transporter family-2 protein